MRIVPLRHLPVKIKGKNSMFKNYLENEEVYLELESFWVDFFLKLIKQSDRCNWIIPYYKTVFSNGKKFMDANPIFSAKSKSSNKSIKIIQELPDDFDGVESWIDTNGKNEMVVICSLSRVNLKKVEEIIVSWIY